MIRFLYSMFLIIKLQILLNITFTFAIMIIFPYLMRKNEYKLFFHIKCPGSQFELGTTKYEGQVFGFKSAACSPQHMHQKP